MMILSGCNIYLFMAGVRGYLQVSSVHGKILRVIRLSDIYNCVVHGDTEIIHCAVHDLKPFPDILQRKDRNKWVNSKHLKETYEGEHLKNCITHEYREKYIYISW